jgi:hypothetical protein
MAFSFPNHINHSKVDGTIIIIDRREGSYFGLDEIGTRVWEAIADTGTPDAAIADLAQTYDVSETVLRADVERLVKDLADKGLILASASPEA